jgi:hypothetical protein
MLLSAADSLGLPRDVGHPAFAPLRARVDIRLAAPKGTLNLASPSPYRLDLDSGLAGRPGVLVLLRFGLELACLRGIAGLPQASATLLAARAAGMFLHVLPRQAREAAMVDPAVDVMARLAGDVLPIAQLTACWRLLAGALASDEEAPGLAALHMVGRLWHLAAPAEALLVSGGDDRLTLDPDTGLNRYLCAPYPMPEVISFGSCTASTITAHGFEAAETVRQDLLAASCTLEPESVLAAASDRIVAELLLHLGVADIAEAVLAASGTDATLLLTGLLAAERPRQTITTVLMSPSETGSGVPEAVQGRHFAPCTASGLVVQKGGAVEGFPPGLSLVSVALRDESGRPRSPEAIASACESAIEAASRRGHVVLHAIDGSKTGLAAPGLLALDLLADRFGQRLDIVVDACQLRIEPALLRRYLDRGWPVLVTGSKFFGAPGFCGAVLFPRPRLQRIAGGGRLPDGLGAYASLSGGSVSRRCPGLLVRWAAALAHMRPFGALAESDIRDAIDRAGGHIRAAMMRDARLRLVPAPRPEGLGWSDRPSVLTFTVDGGQGPLSADALRPIYRALARDMSAALQPSGGRPEGADLASQSCLIGQPVVLADGVGGLRLAVSAAQIADGTDLRPALATVFGKLALLLDHSDAMYG